MTTQPAIVDPFSSLLTKLRDVNAANALIAARAMTPIVERLAIEGAATPDVDLARKMLESLQKVAVHPERQEAARAGATAAAAILQIILDDSIQQEAPKRKLKVLKDVQDVIEVPITHVSAVEDVTWGAEL